MDCEQAIGRIESDLDGELPAEEGVALEAHLATCASCRATLAAFRLQDAELRRAFGPAREAAEAVGERVGAALAAAPTAARAGDGAGGPLRLALALGLAAAAGFLLALVVERRSGGARDKAAPGAAAGARASALDGAIRAAREDTIASLLDRIALLEGALAARGATPDGAGEVVGALALATGRVEVRAPSRASSSAGSAAAAGATGSTGSTGATGAAGAATDAAWTPLASGGALVAGMEVRTAPGVRCELAFACGSLVRLDAGTACRLAGPRDLDLGRGRVYAAVASAEAPFRVRAAENVLVALGTELDVEARPEVLVLTVVEGAVRVEGTREAEHDAPIVRAGERARLAGGRVVERGPVQDLVQATRWVHELLVLKGHEDAELGRRVDQLFAQIGQSKLEHLAEGEIRALGDHCVLPLTRYIQSAAAADSPAKRRRAARILADIAVPWAVPHLIELLGDADGEVRFHAATALERLTGETLGRAPARWRDDPWSSCASDHARWSAWWQEHRARFPRAGS